MSIIERAADKFGRGKAELRPMPAKASAAARGNADARRSAFRDEILDERKSDSPPRVPNQLKEIDLAKLKQAGMVTPNAGRTPLSEQFRAIKRELIRNAFNPEARSVRNGNLIMVTSSLPGEGKTFCSVNLALSIAMEMDHTVLLVDTDVTRPGVLRTLGLEADTGLTDVLLRRCQIAEALIKTNIQTLSIIPPGSNHEKVPELLASQTMSGVLDEMANRYGDRIIIFDSPPLLAASESRALAAKVGQVVVVVEAETTTQHALQEALAQIETCPNISLVYNKGREFPGGENYHYYRS